MQRKKVGYFMEGEIHQHFWEKNIAVESTDKCTNIELFLLSEQF